MELRVWVDGTQRVVCGVKLTTTCQEIVFALAAATRQAGRFTMIERWRNNERLLSPSEQPLVTLQRWGDRMNEVEFILRKTSTDNVQTDRAPITSLSNRNSPSTQTPNTSAGLQQARDSNSRLNNETETNHSSTMTNGHSSSPSNHLLPSSKQQAINDQISDMMLQHSRQYNPTRRPQTVLGPLTSSNSSLNLGSNYVQAQINRYSGSFRPSLSASALPNGTNNVTASPSSSASMLRPLYPDDLTINARSPSSMKNDNGYLLQNENPQYQSLQLAHQPRVNPMTNNYTPEDLYSTINKNRVNHIPPAVPAKPRLINPLVNSTHPQPIQPASVALYPTNVRPRHPPGYLEYLETIANRSMGQQPLMTNLNYPQQARLLQSNIYGRQMNQRQLYHQNGTSPSTSSAGETTNWSQVGHDMLKVIEEQKKVLMNQKNELNLLDNDHEYLEAKQNSVQAELINRIESEIRQLEELRNENQRQIKKLENQDLENELLLLKAEQVRVEVELDSQKEKLTRIETDLAECQANIERLENELSNLGSESGESTIDSENSVDDKNDTSVVTDLKTSLLDSSVKALNCSDDEDFGNESGGDNSDDIATLSDSKLRNAKEVPYVDKRGLMNGIRSLKLDKARGLNRSFSIGLDV